ncbi:hypothetical protein SHM7688_00526 [Shimia marina]|uniref:Uncharacterized protein n=1 Tax=Shimia marina TaxID=321267 RepID=A0A0P1ELJ2_9RHOB|nr:hypothetical protein SHM7688_00526 [Shimia marina]
MHIEQPRHDPFHISVHHCCRFIKRDRGHRRCGIGADAGQFQKLLNGSGKHPIEIIGHNACTFQQIARAGVVPKPGPFRHNIRILRGCKISDARPAFGESQKIVFDSGHGGLLQHNLRHPDPIGIGPHACFAVCRADAPRHLARIVVIPLQQVGVLGQITQVLSSLKNGFAGTAGRGH